MVSGANWRNTWWAELNGLKITFMVISLLSPLSLSLSLSLLSACAVLTLMSQATFPMITWERILLARLAWLLPIA